VQNTNLKRLRSLRASEARAKTGGSLDWDRSGWLPPNRLEYDHLFLFVKFKTETLLPHRKLQTLPKRDGRAAGGRRPRLRAFVDGCRLSRPTSPARRPGIPTRQAPEGGLGDTKAAMYRTGASGPPGRLAGLGSSRSGALGSSGRVRGDKRVAVSPWTPFSSAGFLTLP
jgi:hypothetical protein